MQPFESGSLMQPDWNQPKKMLGPAVCGCAFLERRDVSRDLHLFAVWMLDKSMAYTLHKPPAKLLKERHFGWSRLRLQNLITFVVSLYCTQKPLWALWSVTSPTNHPCLTLKSLFSALLHIVNITADLKTLWGLSRSTNTLVSHRNLKLFVVFVAFTCNVIKIRFSYVSMVALSINMSWVFPGVITLNQQAATVFVIILKLLSFLFLFALTASVLAPINVLQMLLRSLLFFLFLNQTVTTKIKFKAEKVRKLFIACKGNISSIAVCSFRRTKNISTLSLATLRLARSEFWLQRKPYFFC